MAIPESVPDGVDTGRPGEGLGLAYLLTAASAVGLPAVTWAHLRPNRTGHAVATVGCGILVARDASMIASGVPARLGPLPRMLLVVEAATATLATVTGIRASWRRPAPDRVAAVAAAVTLALHTARMAIYVNQMASGPAGKEADPEPDGEW